MGTTLDLKEQQKNIALEGQQSKAAKGSGRIVAPVELSVNIVRLDCVA
jgi:hypothetical protein